MFSNLLLTPLPRREKEGKGTNKELFPTRYRASVFKYGEQKRRLSRHVVRSPLASRREKNQCPYLKPLLLKGQEFPFPFPLYPFPFLHTHCWGFLSTSRSFASSLSAMGWSL